MAGTASCPFGARIGGRSPVRRCQPRTHRKRFAWRRIARQRLRWPDRRGPARARARKHHHQQASAGSGLPSPGRRLPAARPVAAGCAAGHRRDDVARDAGIHLASHREEALRLRHLGHRRPRLSRPRHHPLRDRARHRRQGQPDRQPGQGPGPVALRHLAACGRDHPRQEPHGPGAAQPPPSGRAPFGDHRLARLRRRQVPRHRLTGQGHRRQPGRGRSGQDAPPAGGRYHRFRQVRGHQRHADVHPLQG